MHEAFSETYIHGYRKNDLDLTNVAEFHTLINMMMEHMVGRF